MSRRAARDRFKAADKDAVFRQAGGRCEYYPRRWRRRLFWRRCRFTSDDPRYFHSGHAIPLNASDGKGKGATDWRNLMLQCPPCNFEQGNDVQPQRLYDLIERDRANLAANVRSRWAIGLLAVSAAGLFTIAITQL